MARGQGPASYAKMLIILGIAAVFATWRTVALAKSEEAALEFEDVPAPTILGLGLYRDRVLPVKSGLTQPPCLLCSKSANAVGSLYGPSQPLPDGRGSVCRARTVYQKCVATTFGGPDVPPAIFVRST